MKRILFLLLFLLILTLSSFAEDPDSADVNFRVTVNVPDFESLYGEDYSYINIGFTDTKPTSSFNYKAPSSESKFLELVNHEDDSTFWTDTFHGTLYFYWYAINVDFRVAFRMTNFTSAEAGGDDKIIFIARYEDNYQGEDSELHRFAHLSSRTDPDKITFHYKDTDKDHPGYGYGTFTIDTESFFSHPKTYDDFISIIAALVEVIE